MAIQFVDAAQVPIGPLTCTFYGRPNMRKTSTALSAKNPIIFPFDQGLHRAVNRRGKAAALKKDQPVIYDWREIADLTADDLKQFDTIIVDTVGKCLEVLSRDICRIDPKMGRDGQVSGWRGYGELKTRFRKWLNFIRASGLDVILIAHGREERNDDNTSIRIDAMGSSREEVYIQSDIMGHIFIEDGAYVIDFDPTEFNISKNVGLPRFEIPDRLNLDGFASKIIADARVLMDEDAERREAERREAEIVSDAADKLSTAEEFNDYLDRLRADDAPIQHGKIVLNAGKSKGLEFDNAEKRFVDPVDWSQVATVEPSDEDLERVETVEGAVA